MKISLSSTLIAGLSSTALTIGAHIQTLSESHPFLKERNKKKATEYAKEFNVSIEEAYEKTAFKLPTLSLWNSIEPLVNRAINVVKTDEQLDIEINDDFIIEYYTLTTNIAVKGLKPVVDLLGLLHEQKIHIDQFQARWVDPEEDEVVETEVKTETKVETAPEIVQHNGWTLIPEEYPTPTPFYTTEDKEEFFFVDSMTWKNAKDQQIRMSVQDVRKVLSAKENISDFFKKIQLPQSLINAVRTHYGFEPLVEETKEVTTSSQVELETVKVAETQPE